MAALQMAQRGSPCPKAAKQVHQELCLTIPSECPLFFDSKRDDRLPNGNADETTVRAKELMRYRAIGKYLKSYELPESLTWQAIHEALPKLSKRGRSRSKFIRSGLLELGNLFLQERLLPNWDCYLSEQRLQKYLNSALRANNE
jgi:hypothetical protein